jgi:cell division protein ZipA
MDATTLRIVLIILGAIFLGGIYLYETNRRKRESAQARRRVTEKIEPVAATEIDEPSISMDSLDELEREDVYESPVLEEELEEDEDEDEEEDVDDSEEQEEYASTLDEDTEVLSGMRADDSPILGIDEPMKAESDHSPLDESKDEGDSDADQMEQQDLFAFSAQEESPADVPDLILQINVRAKKTPFDGSAIEKAMHETGLLISDQSIYQRLSSDGSKKVLYSVASMVEPGIFPAKDMSGFETPGLTLFTQLPGPSDGMMIFSDMLYTAERLSAMLLGDLQDGSHSALSKQTIEHMREQIMEHKRQIQLARRKG